MNRFLLWSAFMVMTYLLSFFANAGSIIGGNLIFSKSSVDSINAIIHSIDVAQSKICWRGTKLRGSGKHEGTLNFCEGNFIMENEQLKRGYLKVDMNTIQITDIPAEDVTPIRNLTNHLMHDFLVDQYPEALLEILEVKYLSVEFLQVKAILTIRGFSKEVQLDVHRDMLDGKRHFSSQFSFDRLDWGIGSDRSWLKKKLVDRVVHLKVDIFMCI